MTPAKSFRDILSFRGQIVLFTPSASIALPLELMATIGHAQVVSTRGIEDAFQSLSAWNTLVRQGAHAIFSADQHRYVARQPACSDVVWVGEILEPHNNPEAWLRFSQAMGMTTAKRAWLLPHDAV